MIVCALALSAALAAEAGDGHFEQAKQAVLGRDAAAAIASLEQLLKEKPDHGPARALLGGLLLDVDAARAKKLLAGAPAKPLPAVALAPLPESGLTWVVNAAARMHDEPKAATKQRSFVPVGSLLVLERRDGRGWARVRLPNPRAVAYLARRDADGAFKLSAPVVVPSVMKQEARPGWVREEHLAGEAPASTRLEEKRAAAEAAGRLDEALAWASLAHQVAPSLPRQDVVLRSALRAERWVEAGQALAFVPVRRPWERLAVDLEHAWGCTEGGDPRTLEVYESRQPLPPAICIDLRVRSGDEKKLRRKYPLGPFLKVRIDPFTPSVGHRAWVAVMRSKELVELIEVPAPKPPGNGYFIDVWYALPDEAGIRYDLFFAADRAAAEAAAKGDGQPAISLQRP